jgi:GABA(A) receptor-associated protein
MSRFRKENKLEKRQALFRRIKAKFPERIPIICERSAVASKDFPSIDKVKYLVPCGSTVGEFIANIRKRMEIPAHQALFLFAGEKNILPPVAEPIEFLYDREKSEDGFLYFQYSGENTFG